MRASCVLALVATGCTGAISADQEELPPAPHQPPPASMAPPAVVPTPQPQPEDVATARRYFPGDRLQLLPRRLWRLTNEQIERSVAAALGTPVSIAATLLPEPHDTRYRNHAEQLAVGRGEAEAIGRAAVLVRDAAVRALPRLHPCLADAASGRTCAPGRLRELAEGLFRAPLSTEQATRVDALFAKLAENGAPLEAPAGTVEYLVQSDAFLFRREAGESRMGETRLTGHELAASLSFLFWNEPPDAALRAAAREGKLRAQDQLEAEARRLLADPRFRRAFDDYIAQWLGFDHLSSVAKDVRRFPQWSAELRTQMAGEVSGFLGEVFTRGGGSLTTLLGAREAGRPALLPSVYKQEPRELRRGLILLPGVLAALSGESASKPMSRASLLLDRLFCQKPSLPSGISLPDPPANAAPRTTRQAFEQHENDPNCAGCHRMLDPIAFAFETYDALGAYRSTEGGLPIDPTGTIAFTVTPFGPVSSATELLEKASRHPDVAACAVRQLYEHTFGIAPGNGADPVLREAFERFAASRFDLREILIAFLRSPMFTHRQGS